MDKKILLKFGAVLILLAMVLTPLFSLVIPASASSAAQAQLPTPTAQPDGRIIYIAQAGDSWWIISIKVSVSQDTLLQLNNAKPDDIIQTGQKILIGIVTPTPVVPTQMNTTPTPNILTPVVKGFGKICVVLFDDANGDSIPQPEEALLANGAVSITERSGQVNKTGQTTTGPDTLCFDQLPEGDYNLSVAVPDGYNPTTNMNRALKLSAGDQSTVNFGAQLNGTGQSTTNTATGKNPMVAIVGGVLIIGGIAVGVYFLRSKH
jgi:hypothetical protein